jgi:hypothetical protein
VGKYDVVYSCSYLYDDRDEDMVGDRDEDMDGDEDDEDDIYEDRLGDYIYVKNEEYYLNSYHEVDVKEVP